MSDLLLACWRCVRVIWVGPFLATAQQGTQETCDTASSLGPSRRLLLHTMLQRQAALVNRRHTSHSGHG